MTEALSQKFCTHFGYKSALFLNDEHFGGVFCCSDDPAAERQTQCLWPNGKVDDPRREANVAIEKHRHSSGSAGANHDG